ncbi:MAG TPA: gluconate 2-dehydrogenase subunit 3 family protein [Steroidobacteraceae bacterium]|nr:gluconate 2-dehydrogenase subunit 3 family protein [Steroidobacteraceae bacterium]
MNDQRLPENDSPEMLARREVLRRAAWLLGGAISAPAALAILQGCSAKDAPKAADWQPKFFKGDEAKVVTAVADIIIPHTDTSGALDANVPAFIDSMMDAVYDADAQARFRSGCAEFATANAPGSAGDKAFLEQSREAQTAMVRQALEAAVAADTQPRPFIMMARELTLLGFYTSQPGITENMEYQAVPTAYHGCVPVSQMKKPVYWE